MISYLSKLKSAIFHQHGDSLAPADTHGDKAGFFAPVPELIQDFDGKDCPGAAHRMPPSNCPTVDVDLRPVKAQFPAAWNRLGSKSLLNPDNGRTLKTAHREVFL